MKSSYEDSYKKLVVWKNATRLRKLIYDVTTSFPKAELRRISQMRDAARSVKQNIQEGRKRRGEREFLQALNISRGSLAELKGDIEDSYEDGLLNENHFGVINALICKTDYLLHRLMRVISKPRVGPIQPIMPIEPL